MIGSLPHLGPRDLVEIAIVAILIYQGLLLIRGTRGWHMTLGITAFVLFYYLVRFLQLRTVEWLLGNAFLYFGFALIVIFQSEIRRGLAQLGRGPFIRRFGREEHRKVFEEIVLAATTLSNQKIGALIVVEQEIGLRNYVERGIRLNAILSYDLLVTIFNPRSPLHDGAVIVQQDKIAAASCFLPLTLDSYLSKELGTRHRAAIGVTEETDAIAVIVSEETGAISVAHKGQLHRNLDGPRLMKLLRRMADQEREKESEPEAERRKQEAV